MKRIAKFVLGNSIVTPVGVAVAIACVIFFHRTNVPWLAVAYGGILLLTLVVSTLERVS